jgi:hypothetical protein
MLPLVTCALSKWTYASDNVCLTVPADETTASGEYLYL